MAFSGVPRVPASGAYASGQSRLKLMFADIEYGSGEASPRPTSLKRSFADTEYDDDEEEPRPRRRLGPLLPGESLYLEPLKGLKRQVPDTRTTSLSNYREIDDEDEDEDEGEGEEVDVGEMEEVVTKQVEVIYLSDDEEEADQVENAVVSVNKSLGKILPTIPAVANPGTSGQRSKMPRKKPKNKPQRKPNKSKSGGATVNDNNNYHKPAVASLKQYHHVLSQLQSLIPQKLLAGTGYQKPKTRVWIAALHYIDLFQGSGKVQKIFKATSNASARLNTVQQELFHQFDAKHGFQRTGGKSDKFKNETNNLYCLAQALVHHFQGQQESQSAITGARKASLRKSGAIEKTKALDDAASQSLGAFVRAVANLKKLTNPTPAQPMHYIREITPQGFRPKLTLAMKAEGPHEYYIREITPPTEPPTDVQNEVEAMGHVQEPKSIATVSQAPVSSENSAGLASSTAIDTAPALLPKHIQMEHTAGDAEQAVATDPPQAANDGGFLEQALVALQTQIKNATTLKLDWTNVPLSLFETEMSLKKISKALEQAKDAMAGKDVMMSMG
ncbi:uncharacterized protein HMPREF1541_10779 [Cyphellophora europaea CBS 101466]|uniref:Uncharacterized protein n=1 Tax=Cyphellophora europaea (strain CBS 101466) TaxID=1220924 RepID=W2S850_CYPE1|nr:uncharacterized protein HMPREF1541_10779 [Cyphellophora europaea CBS 101466]ETN44228.1 hypothetical protein HMPREF1541_10779 [Cyphellophora europaea CBS 101466]